MMSLISVIITGVSVTAYFVLLTFGDKQHKWFHIISKKKGNCMLALDVHYDKSHCPGTRIIANEYDPDKITQMWRWDGNMLVNRYSGLVMKLDDSMKLVLAHGTNDKNQQFSGNHDGGYIYTNNNRTLDQVLQLGDREMANKGTSITGGPPYEAPWQLWTYTQTYF